MTRTKPLPVLHIYTRVSTAAQEDKGTSLTSQEKLGHERAKALGFGRKGLERGRQEFQP